MLRVDELRKLGGTPCRHQRPESGCAIHAERPGICRAYRCLWLSGGLEESDRPDRLGAVVDLLVTGAETRLSIQEATPGAYEHSPRLLEIAASFRASIPVRVVEAGNFLDADRPFRMLLAEDEEHRVRGEEIEIFRAGHHIATRRLPLVERLARRVSIAYRRWRVARSDSHDHDRASAGR